MSIRTREKSKITLGLSALLNDEDKPYCVAVIFEGADLVQNMLHRWQGKYFRILTKTIDVELEILTFV